MGDVFHLLTVILVALGVAPALGRTWRGALSLVGEPASGSPCSDRVLTTLLFADIVASTEHLARAGDRKWRELLEAYQGIVRAALASFGGREIDAAGDGFLAAFGAPVRAIGCACAIREAARSLGIEIRAGVHSGECEVIGEKLGGIAVHIGARVCGEAGPGEVLVSHTVRDLVAGSGLEFEERGARRLKGLPGAWRLCALLG